MRRTLLACLFAIAATTCVVAQGTQPVRPPVNTNPEFNGKTLDQWIKDIEDNDASVREHAIKMVSLMGPVAKKAAPAVIRQIRNENDLSPMTNAIIAIGVILPDDEKQKKDAITALISMLNNAQAIVRFQAATSLGNFGPPARNAIDRLTVTLRDPASWEIRKASAYALGRVGYNEKNFPDIKALTALNQKVEDSCKEVRIEALQGLINLGLPELPQERQTLKDHFEKRLKTDKDKYAGIWIRVALMRLDDKAINDANLKHIAAFLKKNDPPGINADAARALGAIGPQAKVVVPDLVIALADKDISLVAWSAWALGRMGGEAKAALPALKLNLEASDPAVKAAAQEAIANINNPVKK
jgi:HEAT repeat protein